MMRNAGPLQMYIPFPPMVKYLIITNVSVWFLGQVLLQGYIGVPLTSLFGLFPNKILFEFHFWQPFSYMFLHSTTTMTHLLFNMLILWFAGGELELRWGRKFFLTYYLVCGVGAGVFYTLCVAIYTLIVGSNMAMLTPVIGASGAIFGLLLAYAILFGERVVYFMMIFPMKARTMVLLLGGIQLMALVASGVEGSNVSYLAHLCGLLSGFIFLRAFAAYRANQSGRSKAKKSRLRLIVNNEKADEDDNQGPKYWN